MIGKNKIEEAVRYNLKAISSGLVDINLLPYPMNESNFRELVAWICLFQVGKGIMADGKIDPETYDILRTDEITVNLDMSEQKQNG